MDPGFMDSMEKDGAGSFGEEFLGPDYQYTDYIMSPD